MHLATKREEESNPTIPGVFLVSIWFTFVSLVPTMFHGFGNCEDLVTGASETGDISKIKHVSGMFSFVFGFLGFFLMWAELACETTDGSIFIWTMHIVGTALK